MHKKLSFVAALLFALALPAEAQDAAGAEEEKAVRRAVETYLYAEEPEEKRRVVHAKAKVYSVDQPGGKLSETPVSTPARKTPKGSKNGRVIQRIAAVEVVGGGAMVKVETDLALGETAGRKHAQYISLLKVDGGWKIVSILMPPTWFTGSGKVTF